MGQQSESEPESSRESELASGSELGSESNSRQARDWNDLATVDPLWAVLSAKGKRNGGWELDEFFATGEAEVAQMLARAAELGRPGRNDSALDFGCGVGRLTRALAVHFDNTLGVDASAQMIEQARRLKVGQHPEQRVETGFNRPLTE